DKADLHALERRLRLKADKADVRRLERRVDRIDRRLRRKADKADLRRVERRMIIGFVAVDARFRKIDERFDAVERRFDELQHWMIGFFTPIKNHLECVVDEHEQRLQDLEKSRKANSEATQ